MNDHPVSGMDLSRALGSGSLFCRWLEAGSAREELEQALQGRTTADPTAAPFWVATGSGIVGQEWVRAHLADLPGPPAEDHDLFLANLGALQAGRAGVVVTGQQPGDMGGPLFTLHKIAAAVALARRLSRPGRPTVPVFWSGDDDDDLAEAMAPRSFDPASGRLFGNPVSLAPYQRGGRQRPCVGNLGAARWSRHALDWLGSGGADPWSALWVRACGEDWTWARLQRCFLLRYFQGTGLVVVSGNDPFLHRSAEPLYRNLLDRRDLLARLGREAGADLASRGLPVPLSDRSLHRHLFRTDGPGRRFLEPGEAVAEAGALRPGVLLRSPVQDWLLRPAAVVVGPGELAYLQQLEPLYRALAIPRCPLVPRLFGWLVPRGFDPAQLAVFAADREAGRPAAAELAERAGRSAEAEVRRLLESELGLDGDRAGRLARGRARRWTRSLAVLFRTEAERRRRAVRPGEPVWVFPQGSRQERVLSALTAAVLWGEPLRDRLLAAADAHLESGGQGRWLDHVLEVDDPVGEAR